MPNRLSSEAQELDPPLRRSLERALDTGLDGLRMHVGPAAAGLTAALGADALTIGNHVYFRDGAFNPKTPAGLALIAHEAAHVAQQSRVAPAAPRPLLDQPGDPWEREAHAFAAAFVSGKPAPNQFATGPIEASLPLIQRHVSYEHRWLGDGATDDLAIVAYGTVPNAPKDTRRTEILQRQIDLMMLWHTDHPEKVDEAAVNKLCPWIRTLRLGPDDVLLTYGELNALPDYFANPPVLESLPQSILLPILQVIRQETYNQLKRLLTGDNPAWRFPLSPSEPWRSPLFNSVMETSDLDKFTKSLGYNGMDHYGGLLARNACHFAPFSWYRWKTSHIIARDLARKAFEVKDKNSDQYRRLWRQAWTYHGYADHFLQDSFAAGHLINKTMVMQWWVEWAKDTDFYIDNWDLIKTMTVYRQPGIAGTYLYDQDYGGYSNDPQTAEEHDDFNSRMLATNVQPDTWAADRVTAYQRYLAFIGSAVTQIALNATHDVYNTQSVWVASEARPKPFEVYGDDTLFYGKDGVEGLKATSETSQLSQDALLQVFETGDAKLSPSDLLKHFPTRAGSHKDNLFDLKTWNETQRAFVEGTVFKDSFVRVKDMALTLLSPRLSPLSRDEDHVAWENDLPDSGYHNTHVLCYGNRLFAACNSYVFEIDPATGKTLHKVMLGSAWGSGDYETTLACDGRRLYAGTHGYVYGINLNNWDDRWDTGVGEHGYHLVRIALCGNDLWAGCNGYTYKIDINGKGTLKTFHTGVGDVNLAYDGMNTVYAGTDGVVSAIRTDQLSKVWDGKTWSNNKPVNVLPVGNRVFASSTGLQELDRGTGKVIREFHEAFENTEARMVGDAAGIYAGAGDNVKFISLDAAKPSWHNSVASLMTDKGWSGHHTVSVLTLNGRMFAACNGYLYEFQSNSGEVTQWQLLSSQVGLGDYDSRMATDGKDVYCGIHGYVYKFKLASR